MGIFHAYDHLEETYSLVQCQQIVINGLEQHVRESELRLMVLEICEVTMEVMISCL